MRFSLVAFLLILGMSGALLAKAKEPVCECRCVKDGREVSHWTVDAKEAPKALSAPDTDHSEIESAEEQAGESAYSSKHQRDDKKGESSFGSVKAPAYPVREDRAVEPVEASAPLEDQADSKQQSSATAKTPAPSAGTSGVSFSELKVLSGSVRIGDTKDEVRSLLGDPYLETQTGPREWLWIYS